MAQNTGWMLLGQGLRLVVQALYFTVIARSLGAQNYGAFVGVVGLVGIVFPFATLGSGYLLIRNVARDPKVFGANFGLSLLTTLFSSGILFFAITGASHFLLPQTIPARLVMMVAASDLFAASIATLCGQAFLAFERLQWTASLNVLLSVSRLTAAALLVARHRHPAALQWGSYYLGSTVVVAVCGFVLAVVKLGPPVFRFSRGFAELREGFYFSVSQSAQTIYNDIDKTMLARLSTLEATGIYGAAYRLIDISVAPISSLLYAGFAGLMRAGAGGISSAFQCAKPLIRRAVGYGAFICVGIIAFAGIVPIVLGGEYKASEEALRWLSLLPLLKAMHFFLSDSLAAAGHQGLRTLIHVSTAAFNVLINLWIIPAYSWRGAAWSSIASDAVLAASMAVAVLVLSRRAQAAAGSASVLAARAEA